MSYSCENCGSEIDDVDADYRCPVCGQKYVFDPTKSLSTPTSSEHDAAEAGASTPDTDTPESETSSGEEGTRQVGVDDVEDQEEEPIWTGANV